MKISVITDQAGNIVGTAFTGRAANGVTYGVSVPKDRFIHVMDVPDALTQGDAVLQLHSHYRVDTASGTPRLVKR